MILNCKKIAEEKILELKKRVNKDLSLGIVQIGQDNVSDIFIREKKKVADKIGVGFNFYKFERNTPFSDLKKKITGLSDDGVVIQLPVKGFDSQRVLNLIPFKKDVDMLSEASVGRFYSGKSDILPPVVSAIDKILKNREISLKGKCLAVIGPGRLVGRPMIIYGIYNKATVLSINELTEDLNYYTKKADVIVTGVGKPNLLRGEMIKKDAVVFDAGTMREKGELKGDVDLESVSKKAKLVTPVPGGVGPLTVVSLFENLIKRNVD